MERLRPPEEERLPPYLLFLHFAFAASIATLSAVVTAILIRYLPILDLPNERSSHSRPTQRGGGIAIVCGFLVGISLIHFIGDITPIKTRYFMGFLVSAFVIAGMSIYDDFRLRSATVKLVAQLCAIAIAIAAGIVIDELHLPGLHVVGPGWWGYMLTLLWILGLTNAYNFMDGLDGLAASSAAIASGFLSVISFNEGSHFIYLASMVLCAASIGFLVFNISPARIFMGDVGSTFLGFSFAVMAVIAARYDLSHTSLFVVPLLLFHFIFDSFFTFFRRLVRGDPVMRAHKTHLYQLLNQVGFSHGKVTLIYSVMAAGQGIGAVFMVGVPGDNRIWVFLPFLILDAAYAYWLLRLAKRKKLL